MVICISPNPAIDRRLRLEQLERGGINRACSAEPLPGGKAAHVAMAARALGEEVMWVGFLGGSTGAECELGLAARGIPTSIVRTRAETRTNLEIIEQAGTITEVLEPGGEVSPSDVERFLSICRDLFSESGASAQVVLSGSLPPGAPDNLYAQLIRSAHHYGCEVLLDTSGEALRQALEAAPDVVKPNHDEAEWITGITLSDEQATVEAARRIIDAGARRVALSLGAKGMLWLNDGTAAPTFARPPSVEAGSTVGCGDVALAGLAVARSRGLSWLEALRLAVACGTANCMATAPGLIDPRQVELIAPNVVVRSLEQNHRPYKLVS
jgi:1-phosphofructokinase family hexose kinase